MVFDIVIHNGLIITVNSDFDIIENGVVCISNGTIHRIEAQVHDTPLPEAKEIIDANGGIIMPGLVNTHTHLPMTLFRGLADDLPLALWLDEFIFPCEAKYLTPETVRLGTLVACAEMMLSGTTTCCDGYFFENDVASAIYESGIRGVLGQGVIDFPAPGVPDPSDNIENAVRFFEKWQKVSPLITPSIFCHSPYTCSQETLKKAKAASDSKALLFQIHAAETKNEYIEIQTEHHTTPVKYLDRIGVLDENTLMVHGVWLDDDDIEIIAKRRSTVSHNPQSNMKLASGIAPVPDLLTAGVTVGLGTDGCASNNDLDLFREMDTGAKLHKVNLMDPTVMDAKTVLKMATIEGAKAIGVDEHIGSLEPGKQADIIIVDADTPHLVPMYNPYSHIVYAANGSEITCSIINGRPVLLNGQIRSVDEEEAFSHVRRIAEEINGIVGHG